MSSLVFLADHGKFRKGQGPVSIPKGEADILVANGVARRWNGGQESTPSAAAQPPVDVMAKIRDEAFAAIKEARDECAAMLADADAAHEKEVSALKAEIEALKKQLAEKPAKKDK